MRWNAIGLMAGLLLLPNGAQDPSENRIEKLQPILPPELEFAAEIKERFGAAGLDVFAVMPEKLSAVPGAERAVLFLTGQKRMIFVFFFPGESDAEGLSVTYTRNPRPGALHRYRIEGPAVPETGATRGHVIDDVQPLYFTLHGRWLIETADPELDFAVKKALGEAGPAAYPRGPCVPPRVGV